MFMSNGFFFFQAEDGIRDDLVTGVQTCPLPILNTPDRHQSSRCPWSRAANSKAQPALKYRNPAKLGGSFLVCGFGARGRPTYKHAIIPGRMTAGDHNIHPQETRFRKKTARDRPKITAPAVMTTHRRPKAPQTL